MIFRYLLETIKMSIGCKQSWNLTKIAVWQKASLAIFRNQWCYCSVHVRLHSAGDWAASGQNFMKDEALVLLASKAIAKE